MRCTSTKSPFTDPLFLHDTVIGTGPTAGWTVRGTFWPLPVWVRQ